MTSPSKFPSALELLTISNSVSFQENYPLHYNRLRNDIMDSIISSANNGAKSYVLNETSLTPYYFALYAAILKHIQLELAPLGYVVALNVLSEGNGKSTHSMMISW